MIPLNPHGCLEIEASGRQTREQAHVRTDRPILLSIAFALSILPTAMFLGSLRMSPEARHQQLPSEMRPYDLNRDGYLDATEAKAYLELQQQEHKSNPSY